MIRRAVLAVVALALTALPTGYAAAASPPVLLAQAGTDDAVWNTIKHSGDPAVFESFLEQYPNSSHAADARAKLDAVTDQGGAIAAPQHTTPAAPKPMGRPAPTQSVSLAGEWTSAASGNVSCGKAQISIVSKGGRLSGGTHFGGSRFSSIVVDGRNFSFDDNYTDIFGKPATIHWIGELAPDGNSASGHIIGSWQNGCVFRMTRQSVAR